MRTLQTVQRGKIIRSGLISLLLTDLSKDIVFSSNMPSTNYSIHFETTTSIPVVFGVSNKTVSGFTILSTGVAATIKYKAIED